MAEKTKVSDLRGKNEAELKGRLKELASEGFKARFTTEPKSSLKGAQDRKRRKEAARIQTVLKGRQAYDRTLADLKVVEERLAKLGKADPFDCRQRERVAANLCRKSELERAKAALSGLKGK